MCLMVLLVSILAFGLLAASPIDPLQTNVGQTALGSMSPEQIARLRSYWGTDLPPVERYLNWLKDSFMGKRTWEPRFCTGDRWRKSSVRRS